MACGGGSGGRGTGGGGGRIHPHQRATDNDTAPIAADVALNEADEAAIEETEGQGMKNRCRKDYRNRNKRFMTWLEENYTEYYNAGTRQLSAEERAAPNLYHFNHTRDLIYSGFRGDIFKAFLSSTKVKHIDADGNPILKSPEDLRKYGDAIRWGAEVAGQRLPVTYYEAVDKWKAAYKKEYSAAKKEGRVEENEAEPINSKLFTNMCIWAVKENNIFVWVFGLLQWNLMARSIGVDPIGFHNLRRGVSDSIEVVPDNSKADQAGEFVTMKNVYGNPLNPVVNVFLALAVWVSLNSALLCATEKLFHKKGVEEGSASKKYCRQLAEMMKRHNEEVMKHVSLKRANPHGIRKVSRHKCSHFIAAYSYTQHCATLHVQFQGAAGHSTSCCLFPPSLIAVLARGEWSLGKIIDTYFKFGYGGDTYLGQVLSLKDANKSSFSTLPAHWKDPNDPLIQEGVKCCFPGVLEKHTRDGYSPSGLLDLFLAQIVYHADYLKETVAENPSHHFGSLPLVFDNPGLLAALAEKVTLEESPDMPFATGIPPHIQHSIDLRTVIDICGETQDGIKRLEATMTDTIKTAVSDGIDEKMESDGNVNQAILDRALQAFRKNIMDDLRDVLPIGNARTLPAAPALDNSAVIVAASNTFQYGGRFW